MAGAVQRNRVPLDAERQADSRYPFRLLFPANVTGNIVADLPVNTPITQTIGATEFPGVTWSVDLTDTIVPTWGLAPYNMVSGVGITKTITLDDVGEFYAEMDGTNLVGSATPFVGTLTSTLSIPPDPGERTFLDTFNLRWQSGLNPAELKLWAVYLDGPATAVALNGLGEQSLVAELFVSNGARVGYFGPAGTHDARTMCTVIKCFDPGSQLYLINCELGTTWTKGSIRAENGAYIKIDAAKLVNDIALQAVGGSTIEVTNVDPASAGVFDCCADATSQILGLTGCSTCP